MSGNWSLQERIQISTWRELKGSNRVLNYFASFIQNKTVKLNTDNKNVAHILQVGSKKEELQHMTVNISNVCKQNILEPAWLPRTQNTSADELSRIIDHDVWSLKFEIFQQFENTWGPYTIDSHYNI